MADHSLSPAPHRDTNGRSGFAKGLAIAALAFTVLLAANALLISHLTHGTPTGTPASMMQGEMSDTNLQMSSAADAPIAVTTISKEKLAHVPGKEITVQMLVFKPGALAPEHHHAGSVTVYVLAGTIRSQLAGGPAIDYHAGQSFFEPVGTTHMFAQNPSSTEEARVIAIHVAEESAQLTTYH